MRIFDLRGQEVIHLYRPLACQECCFPCCLQLIEVTSASGEIFGTVEQNWTLCKPSYSIKNTNGETVLYIEGPICRFPLCCDVEFQVLNCPFQFPFEKKKRWNFIILFKILWKISSFFTKSRRIIQFDFNNRFPLWTVLKLEEYQNIGTWLEIGCSTFTFLASVFHWI